MDRDAFIATVARGVRSPRDHDILMFVHGFRTTFTEAINSASELPFDLKYGGVLMAFSWPSGDQVTGYDHYYGSPSESIKDVSSLMELLTTCSWRIAKLAWMRRVLIAWPVCATASSHWFTHGGSLGRARRAPVGCGRVAADQTSTVDPQSWPRASAQASHRGSRMVRKLDLPEFAARPPDSIGAD
jgi:Alpha/beta hydrolase of unknown function (DUF900)